MAHEKAAAAAGVELRLGAVVRPALRLLPAMLLLPWSAASALMSC